MNYGDYRITGMTIIKNNYLYQEESKRILGLAIQLHKELGCGFKEKVYQDAFEILLIENNIPYEREKHSTITFHGKKLEHDFFFDFLCYGCIIVELKAYSDIIGEFEAQVINYLKVSNLRLGLLLNYGSKSLQYRFYRN